MREKLSNIGLVIAIIVAGVSLPTAIVSLSKTPTVNNYYDTNHYNNQTYYNQTYYNQTWNNGLELEPDYSLPLETATYYNLTGNPEWYHYRVYNATGEYTITWYVNQTEPLQQRFVLIQDSLFDLWNEDRVNSGKEFNDIAIGSGFLMKYSYTFPFSDTWHIILQSINPIGYELNVTVRCIINKI